MLIRQIYGLAMVVLLNASAAFASPAAVLKAKWVPLFQNGKIKQARQLCQAALRASDTATQVEAQKCLANIDLDGQDVICLEGNDQKGGMIHGCFLPKAAKRALAHLNAALKLAPQDLTLHNGRLYILKRAQLYNAMAKALARSCTIYSGPHALSNWIQYPNQFFEDRQFRLSLLLLNVLEKKYPNSHRIEGNIGAAYEMLGEDQKGLPHIQRAVALAPADPIDNWNLARAYDYLNQIQLARIQYPKALSLEKPSDKYYRSNFCIYAHFVEIKLKHRRRACKEERKYCPAKDQMACLPLTPDVKPAN